MPDGEPKRHVTEHVSHRPWWEPNACWMAWSDYRHDREMARLTYLVAHLRSIMTDEECDEFDEELISGPLPTSNEIARRIMAY
jgi:hypothetical protein